MQAYSIIDEFGEERIVDADDAQAALDRLLTAECGCASWEINALSDTQFSVAFRSGSIHYAVIGLGE